MERIKKLLHGQNFSDFTEKKKEHDLLQKILLSNVSKKFKEKIFAKNILNHTLLIEAENSAVASQLKLVSSEIIDKINGSSQLENKIQKIKINVSILHPKNPKRNIKKIPSTANQTLQELKENMSDSPLKNIINGLFKTKK
jgi:hypothetical protein